MTVSKAARRSKALLLVKVGLAEHRQLREARHHAEELVDDAVLEHRAVERADPQHHERALAEALTRGRVHAPEPGLDQPQLPVHRLDAEGGADAVAAR